MAGTFFLKNGTSFMVTDQENVDLHDHLPTGTYTVKFDEMRGVYYLESIDNFEVKGKIYGDTLKNADRILRTFKARPNSTGVMLSGEKGSGKTLLAKELSLLGVADDIPTIVINQPWHGEEFNGFMQQIEQPTIVIFDEFEKVYDKEQQEKMLTLLDGVYPSKKLFIITCNDKWRVNEHMRNRPGRIFYRIDYSGLDTDFIKEYCEDNLDAKEHIESICKVSAMFPEFNFDILKAMVEEMNRYGETPQQVMKVLNAKPEFSDSAVYKMTLTINDLDIPEKDMEESTWRGNPLTNNVQVYYYTKKKGGERNWNNLRFSSSDLNRVDADTGNFHFVNAKGIKLALTKVENKPYDYWQAF